MGIAKALDVDVERIEVQFAGLNHMVYGLDVYLDGVSIMDQVLDELGNPNSQWSMKNIEAKNWEPSFVKGLGVIPCPYHRYYYKTKDMLEEEQKAAQEKGTRAEVVQQVEQELFELYKDPDLSIKPPQLEKEAGPITAMRPVT